MALLTLEYTRDKPKEFAVMLAFLSGCVELAMGVLKLGKFNSKFRDLNRKRINNK